MDEREAAWERKWTEALKDNEKLESENAALRAEVESLRAERDALKAEALQHYLAAYEPRDAPSPAATPTTPDPLRAWDALPVPASVLAAPAPSPAAEEVTADEVEAVVRSAFWHRARQVPEEVIRIIVGDVVAFLATRGALARRERKEGEG